MHRVAQTGLGDQEVAARTARARVHRAEQQAGPRGDVGAGGTGVHLGRVVGVGPDGLLDVPAVVHAQEGAAEHRPRLGADTVEVDPVRGRLLRRQGAGGIRHEALVHDGLQRRVVARRELGELRHAGVDDAEGRVLADQLGLEGRHLVEVVPAHHVVAVVLEGQQSPDELLVGLTDLHPGLDPLRVLEARDHREVDRLLPVLQGVQPVRGDLLRVGVAAEQRDLQAAPVAVADIRLADRVPYAGRVHQVVARAVARDRRSLDEEPLALAQHQVGVGERLGLLAGRHEHRLVDTRLGAVLARAVADRPGLGDPDTRHVGQPVRRVGDADGRSVVRVRVEDGVRDDRDLRPGRQHEPRRGHVEDLVKLLHLADRIDQDHVAGGRVLALDDVLAVVPALRRARLDHTQHAEPRHDDGGHDDAGQHGPDRPRRVLVVAASAGLQEGPHHALAREGVCVQLVPA